MLGKIDAIVEHLIEAGKLLSDIKSSYRELQMEYDATKAELQIVLAKHDEFLHGIVEDLSLPAEDAVKKIKERLR